MQVPTLPWAAHVWHTPEQSVLQQTPSEQCPDEHWLLSLHASPAGVLPSSAAGASRVSPLMLISMRSEAAGTSTDPSCPRRSLLYSYEQAPRRSRQRKTPLRIARSESPGDGDARLAAVDVEGHPRRDADAPASTHSTVLSVARDFTPSIWLSEHPSLVFAHEPSSALKRESADRPATIAPAEKAAVAAAAVQKYHLCLCQIPSGEALAGMVISAGVELVCGAAADCGAGFGSMSSGASVCGNSLVSPATMFTVAVTATYWGWRTAT